MQAGPMDIQTNKQTDRSEDGLIGPVY
jgi:hypothetical protein